MLNKLHLEAQFSVKNITRATEIIAKKIGKNLNTELERYHALSSGRFRKKRVQDLYTLKYELMDDYHTVHRVVSFLWSSKQGGQLVKVEFYRFGAGKSTSSKSSWSKFRPEISIDVYGKSVIQVINLITNYFEESWAKEYEIIINKYNNLLKEYHKLYNRFKKLGGKMSEYFYRLDDKEDYISKFFGSVTGKNEPANADSARYHINTIKKMIGMKYDSNWTNEKLGNGRSREVDYSEYDNLWKDN